MTFQIIDGQSAKIRYAFAPGKGPSPVDVLSFMGRFTMSSRYRVGRDALALCLRINQSRAKLLARDNMARIVGIDETLNRYIVDKIEWSNEKRQQALETVRVTMPLT